MNSRGGSKRLLKEYLQVRTQSRLIAQIAEGHARQALAHLGGVAGSWRSDFSETCYTAPQRIDGRLVDLSTPDKVHKYYDSCSA
jgi:hypothetical protein